MREKTAAATAADVKARGMALKNAGQDVEAAAPLAEALRLDPSLADVHFALAMIARTKPEAGVDIEAINEGIARKDRKRLLSSYGVIMVVLRQKRKYREAVICQEEICRLRPDDAMALADLGLLLNLTGDTERGAVVLSQALALAPADKTLKGLYSVSLHNPAFSRFYPVVRAALLACFTEPYEVHLRNFWAPWINHMIHDPAFSSLCAARTLDESAFDSWVDGLDEKSGAFLADPYLTGGLRFLVIADTLMERVFTLLRRYICVRFGSLTETGRIALFEPFLAALAEQCFFNEYLYDVTAEEEAALGQMDCGSGRAAAALGACYAPLYRLLPDSGERLAAFAADDPAFARLVKTQFGDIMEEARLKEGIPAFGVLANEVSQAVRGQYEENPYPRWTTICTVPLPNDDQVFDPETRSLPFQILIAGCGTGRHAIGSAIRYPNARITAIDLSRASLAYGLRKARECGMAERIKFIHADILAMKDWEEPFDIIECAGVLHHMEDPFAGWEALNAILKPNGLFKIGLYSEIARQPIVRARELIAEKGFPATPEGIRACRKAIAALPATDPIRAFVGASVDFFTLSAVRDLIFHVQEHRMTLPQIAAMMEKLGLAPVRFLANSPESLYRYDRMFPDDSSRKSFENWERIEQKWPLTFAGMYQFWCQKTRPNSL